MRYLLAPLALCVAMPAQADWEFTRWGMSPEEVVAASGPSAKIVAADPDTEIWDMDRLAVDAWERDGIVFEVGYHFDDGARLQFVDLLHEGPNCDRLVETSLARWGASQTERQSLGNGLLLTTHIWTDPENGDTLRVSNVTSDRVEMGFCKLMVLAPGVR